MKYLHPKLFIQQGLMKKKVQKCGGNDRFHRSEHAGKPVLAVFGRRLCSSNDIRSLWQQHQSQVPPLSLGECCSYRPHLCSLGEPLCGSSTTCSLIKSDKARWAELRPKSCEVFFFCLITIDNSEQRR